MKHHLGNSAKPVWSKWQEFRRRARKTAYSSEEFNEAERTNYDLDDDSDYPGRITGEDNPESWLIETESGEKVDIRDLDGH